MSAWSQRSLEEKNLLNPAFSSILIWKAAYAYKKSIGSPLPFELCFLILPIILHKWLRENLPRDHRTSFTVWLETIETAKIIVSERAPELVPYTREALLFSSKYKFVSVAGDGISADESWRNSVDTLLKAQTGEVKDCAKRAEFLAVWFAKTGNTKTIMSLLGVKP